MKKIIVSKQEINQLIKLYNEGKTRNQIGEIMGMKKGRVDYLLKPLNIAIHYKLWTPKEQDYLRKNHGKIKVADIAKKLNRGISAVGKQIERLKLAKKIPKKWSVEETQWLRDNYSKLGMKGCGDVLKRSQSSVATHARDNNIEYYISPQNPNNKICGSCKEEKPKTEFFKNNQTTSGLASWCRSCCSINMKAYRPRYTHQRKTYSRKYKKHLRETSIDYRLECSLRLRMYYAIKGNNGKKLDHFHELLGCSIKYAKSYLESKFQPGMTWENHSNFGWHIDHIIPCDSFNLTNLEEQKKCFHYTNLQPLWWYDNLKKGNKIMPQFQHLVLSIPPSHAHLSYDHDQPQSSLNLDVADNSHNQIV